MNSSVITNVHLCIICGFLLFLLNMSLLIKHMRQQKDLQRRPVFNYLPTLSIHMFNYTGKKTLGIDTFTAHGLGQTNITISHKCTSPLHHSLDWEEFNISCITISLLGFCFFNRVRVENNFSFTRSLSVSFLGLWNLVFLFSNLSLVFLMPFAYFFTESEGFAGSKKVRHVISVTVNANTEHLNSVLCLMSIWYVFSPLKGDYGASLWDCCNAAAAQSAGPGHFLGGISPHPSQHCPRESLW